MRNMRLELTIFVEPQGKASAKTVTKNGRTWSYTPQNTIQLEARIREAIMKQRKHFIRDVPLKLEATFYFLKAKSAPKSRLLPITRPDLDNCTKLLTDSLELYLFDNDSQITSCTVRKRYNAIPKIHFIIEEDKEDK